MAFCATCGSSLTETGALCNSCGVTATRAAAQAEYSMAGAGLVVSAPVSSTVESPVISNNVAALLSYLLAPLAGIVFLMIEPYKGNRWVRFHVFQSIFLFVGWIGLWIAWSVMSAALSTLSSGLSALIILPIDVVLAIGGMAYWVFLMYEAYSGQRYEVPFVGRLAQQQADK